MKRCSKCGENKPRSQFNVARQNRDGLSSWCRACYADYNAAKQAVKRRAAEVVKLSLERVCRHCAAAIPPSRRADAKYCSDACTRRAVGLRWHHTHKDRLRRRDEGTLFQAARTEALRQRNKANPEWGQRAARQRRARKRKAAVMEHVHPLVVLEMCDGVCGVCGEGVDPLKFDVDHVVPLSRGGEHSYGNVQVAHPRCNRQKHAALPWEMSG